MVAWIIIIIIIPKFIRAISLFFLQKELKARRDIPTRTKVDTFTQQHTTDIQEHITTHTRHMVRRNRAAIRKSEFTITFIFKFGRWAELIYCLKWWGKELGREPSRKPPAESI